MVVILLQLRHAARRLLCSHSSVCDRRPCGHHSSATQPFCQETNSQPCQYIRQEAVWSFFFSYSAICRRICQDILPGDYFSAISMSATGDRVAIIRLFSHCSHVIRRLLSPISVYAIGYCVFILLQLLRHVVRRLLFSHFSGCDRIQCGYSFSAIQPCDRRLLSSHFNVSDRRWCDHYSYSTVAVM